MNCPRSQSNSVAFFTGTTQQREECNTAPPASKPNAGATGHHWRGPQPQEEVGPSVVCVILGDIDGAN